MFKRRNRINNQQVAQPPEMLSPSGDMPEEEIRPLTKREFRELVLGMLVPALLIALVVFLVLDLRSPG